MANNPILVNEATTGTPVQAYSNTVSGTTQKVPANTPVDSTGVPFGTNTNPTTTNLGSTDSANLASVATSSSTNNDTILASGTVTAVNPLVINNTSSKGTLAFTAAGSWTGSVAIEASLDGSTWFSTTYVPATSGNAAASFSAPTSGQINIVAFPYIRFRSNTITSGLVTVTTILSRNVATVMLDNSIPTGSNNIGSVGITAGSAVTANVGTTGGLALDATLTSGNQKTQLVDSTATAISNLSVGAGQNGLLVATGGTAYVTSTLNSSVAQLAVGSVFTGGVESVFNQTSAQINISACDQPLKLTVNQYLSASSVPQTTVFVIPAYSPVSLNIIVPANFFNVTVQNTGVSTTTLFNLNVTYGNLSGGPLATTVYGNQPTAITEVAGTPITGGTLPVSGTISINAFQFQTMIDLMGQLVTEHRILNVIMANETRLSDDLDNFRQDVYFNN